jgi:hypothetical protein
MTGAALDLDSLEDEIGLPGRASESEWPKALPNRAVTRSAFDLAVSPLERQPKPTVSRPVELARAPARRSMAGGTVGPLRPRSELSAVLIRMAARAPTSVRPDHDPTWPEPRARGRQLILPVTRGTPNALVLALEGVAGDLVAFDRKRRGREPALRVTGGAVLRFASDRGGATVRVGLVAGGTARGGRPAAALGSEIPMTAGALDRSMLAP